MSDNAEKLAQFKAVTGTNDERARFFLDSATGNLEMALASFFDGDGEQESNSDMEVIDDQPESQQPSAAMSKGRPQSKKPSSKFATIHSLNQSSDDEEEGQAFYAGGSEHSGQQVLGPKKKDFVQDMFKSVKEHGVEVLERSAPGGSRGKAFQGTGYKLGQTNEDTEEVPGTPRPPQPAQVTLKLWKEGFSVDSGDLRLYTDPANQEFLNSVRRGEIPRELHRGASEVHVSMEDHRMETFVRSGETQSRHVFQGTGHTLGSPVPLTVGAPSAEDSAVNEDNARVILNVDKSQPTTNLQIRLADGSRLVGEFNHTHTVQDVRNYIVSARPQYETSTFSLMTAYPSKVLDDDQTLSVAGILGSAIIQKLT
ncbi:NSFL1 cofactor p47-like [Atheta coriaria]|uniref:NSFL1 cofactor p47-like n=1 Tax=Dalotia coriaria TaxID=877792 RepID=UPI0031F428CB